MTANEELDKRSNFKKSVWAEWHFIHLVGNENNHRLLFCSYVAFQVHELHCVWFDFAFGTTPLGLCVCVSWSQAKQIKVEEAC